MFDMASPSVVGGWMVAERNTLLRLAPCPRLAAELD
jgi:hypothetical protein